MAIDFKQLTKPYKQEMIAQIKGFCGINSEFDEKTSDELNPFGIGVSEALRYFASLARKDGFEVINHKNMLVEVLVGQGDKNITIMAHADVVPAGEGWDQNPYEVKETNDELIGRGVADDKGPCLACYYGLKALRDNNLLGNYKIRFLVGGNEESGSRGMFYYFHELKKEIPTYGFSPDANFPVIYAEKGMFNIHLSKKVSTRGLISISGGVATNAVISRCKLIWEKQEKFIKYLKDNNANFEYKENDNNYEITFIGESAHGSVPWMGVNAAIKALEAIYGYSRDEDIKAILNVVSDPRARGIDAYYESKDMNNGTNSFNLGKIYDEDGVIHLVIDFRHVNNCTYESLTPKMEKAANKQGLSIKFGHAVPLLYYPVDSPLISTLVKIYREESGDYDTPPLAIGGGTYAKVTKNVVAYGLEMPGFDPRMHAPGEHIKIAHLDLGMAVYARAIYELGKLIENEN